MSFFKTFTSIMSDIAGLAALIGACVASTSGQYPQATFLLLLGIYIRMDR